MTRIILFIFPLIVSCGTKTVEKEIRSKTTEQYIVHDKLPEVDTIKASLSIWDSLEIKVSQFKEGVLPQTDLNKIPEDFQEFYRSFLLDSLNQKSKIAFNTFMGVLGECDTTIRYNNQNWEYTNWDFTEYFTINNHTNSLDSWSNYFYSSLDKFYYEFRLNEIGIIYQVGFIKIDQQWALALYNVNAC